MADKIVVVHGEFVSAASALPKMKRAPRGSFGSRIPTDTLLYSTGGRLAVFTPARKTIMGMAGAWSICVAADARRLALLCSKLKANDFLALAYVDGFIVLNDSAFRIPGQPAERPEGE